MKYFIFLYFSLNSLVYALDCSSVVEVEYRQNNKLKNLFHEMCILNEGKSFISSVCLSKCMATNSRKRIQVMTKAGQGSPDHINCRRFGGSPMISLLRIKKDSVQTTLCIFKDGSMATLDLVGSLNEK